MRSEKLNSDSGAGANAGSSEDMKFVATDPLSELVWSPQNGLSLKRADSSFVDKKPALLWGAGLNNMVLSPSQNVSAGRFSNEEPINEQNLMSQDAFHLRNETACRNISGRTTGIGTAVIPDGRSGHEDSTGTGCYVEESTFVVGVAEQKNEKDGFRNWKGDCTSGPSNTPVVEMSESKDKIASSFPADLRPDLALNEPLSGPLPGDPTSGGKDVVSGNQTSRTAIDLTSEVHLTEECEANDTLVRNLTYPGKRHEESASVLEKVSKKKITMTYAPSVHPLEKLESTSENDLRNLASKNFCGAASKIVASESAHEVKNSFQQKETLPIDMAVSSEHSPTTSRILRYRRKGKEKALSDGYVNERMSKEDDDSHESVESCNGSGLFSTGKKRWSFEQQLIVGSKKVKQQIQETPGSTSSVKKDSSFLNWISNMMKGSSKSNLDKSHSLDLTLAHPNYGHESSDQKLISYKENQDSGCRNVGFQSIFQSLYCPKTKGQERTSDDDYQELAVVSGPCNISATPLAFNADSDNLCKQFLLPNEKFNESTSEDGAGTATQLKISSANFGPSPEYSKGNSEENKISCNVSLALAQVGGGTDFNSAMGKHKMSNTENVDSEPPLKVKKTHNSVHGSAPLRSLWITRFSPKTSFPLSNLDNQNQRKVGALDCSFSCHRLIPCSQNPNCFFNDLNIVEAGSHSTKYPPVVVDKALQNCAAEAETSSGFNRIKSHDNQKSICKLNPIMPSPRFQNSEAMASDFARRLDALRRIMPSDDTDNAAFATITCFFCGMKGHHLRDCSELTDGELKDLLMNINSYIGAEKLPCLCIRCFQLNHWAVSCPNSTSRGQSLLEGNWFSPIAMQLNKRNDESNSLLYGNNSLFQARGAHTTCDLHDPQREADLKFNQKLGKVATSDRMLCHVNLIKDCTASGSGEKKLSENQTMPFCNFIDRHVSEVAKGIFDFIKQLRLSRTDILKWMNSHMSFAHLNGFFLRLRLGKWEEGLGGTGYYVACITGAQRETGSPQTLEKSLSVNVGGIKCLAESQYISNHDFLEDELMAWWSATVKSGGKIPSEEDLRPKIKERKMLGL